jgi:hypothetical protein
LQDNAINAPVEDDSRRVKKKPGNPKIEQGLSIEE